LAALSTGKLSGKVNITFGMVVDRCPREKLPTVRYSTQTTIKSQLELQLRPKWDEYRLPDRLALDSGAFFPDYSMSSHDPGAEDCVEHQVLSCQKFIVASLSLAAPGEDSIAVSYHASTCHSSNPFGSIEQASPFRSPLFLSKHIFNKLL
jgi:hypothetical protein